MAALFLVISNQSSYNSFAEASVSAKITVPRGASGVGGWLWQVLGVARFFRQIFANKATALLSFLSWVSEDLVSTVIRTRYGLNCRSQRRAYVGKLTLSAACRLTFLCGFFFGCCSLFTGMKICLFPKCKVK